MYFAISRNSRIFFLYLNIQHIHTTGPRSLILNDLQVSTNRKFLSISNLFYFFTLKFKNILTSASNNFSNLGLKKYRIPLSAPSNVRALISSIMMIKNGNVAVKYRTFAEDFILFQMAKQTSTQAHTKHATSSQRIISKSSIPFPI